jgi:3-deoxy-D-manno-octulosonic-acid transferase
MWWLYRFAFALALVIVGPWYALRRRSALGELVRGRLALDPATVDGRPLWIHAVSVGEVLVAGIFARTLPRELPLVVTTITPTGMARARAVFAERATVLWAPLDLAGPIERFLGGLAPRGLVLIEGDYWPLTLEWCRRRELPIVVVNGRIGDRSFSRLRRFPGLTRVMHRRARRLVVQAEVDRERLVALGVAEERIEVAGNLKFDAEPKGCPQELGAAILAVAGGRPLAVAGSTMPGEDELVLEAWRQAGGAKVSLLVIAPRHPERFDRVVELVGRLGLSVVRRSALPVDAAADVVVLDSVGELAGVYALATVAFVGGSLVPTGGHNPIEPAQHGVAVAVGPSQENFRDVAAMFERAAAWACVRDGDELGTVWRRWLEQPAERRRVGTAARELVAASRGAAARSAAAAAREIGW